MCEYQGRSLKNGDREPIPGSSVNTSYQQLSFCLITINLYIKRKATQTWRAVMAEVDLLAENDEFINLVRDI